MNYEKRFLEIKSFLQEYFYLVDQEMLNRFESTIPTPFDEWIVELSALKLEDRIDLENNYHSDLVTNPALLSFIKKSKELIKVEQFHSTETALSPELTRKMSHKKRHEISRIKSLLTNEDISNFVDIGSGAGHLSSALVNDIRSSICIDASSEFQSIGKDKIKRWTPTLLAKLKFIHKEIHSPEDILMPTDTGMLLGLHCCGPLSTIIIKALPKRILSLGCCYHKLIDEYNISALSQDSPLTFSNHALTSAAKGHCWQTMESFQKKINVKRFRYTLHFLLLEKFNQSFVALGNAKASDYNGEFSSYCYKFAPETRSLSKDEIDHFYQIRCVKINLILCGGTLRALLSRVIEMYLVLDRVIYLKEHGKDPKLLEIFDRKLSPRNLAIYI